METYLATAVVLALSLLLGGALCSIGGSSGWDWLAPAVGLSAAMLLAWLAIDLPAAATSAAVVLAAAAAGAAVTLWRRVSWRRLAEGAPPALLVAALTSLPFLASDRIGVLGESLNDDLGFHLDYAYALAQGGEITGRIPHNYPVGPHALAGTLAEALGTTAEPAFTGLVLAIPILAALTGLAALRGVPLPARVLAASLVGIGYPVAGVVVQSSFKELVVALLVLGFAVVVRRTMLGELAPLRALGLSALLAGAACTSFSFPALAWFVAGGIVAWAAQVVLERGRAGLRTVVLVGGGAAVAVIAATALLQLAGFFEEGPLRYTFSRGREAVVGNLAEPLSPFQALSVWPSDDIRLEPDNGWWRLGVALAVVAVLAGVVLAALRREIALVGVTAAAGVIYGAAALATNPYNSAKALAIAGPVVTATALAGLLGGRARPAASGKGGARWIRLAPIALAGLWGLLAFHSSGTLLRAAFVRADHNQSTDLRRLASTVAGEPVAFQGQDAYARWELRRADYVYTGGTADLTGESGALRTAPVPAKATRMIAPRSLYAPSAGPEFRLLKRTRWYDAFRRGAPPRSLFVARQEAAPGALLSCRHARTRALARHGWSALVKAQPVVGPGRAWTDPTGRPAFASEDFTLLALERTLRQQLALPPGRWELSLRYYSREPIRVRAGPLTRPMPAYLADRTSFWRVGSVTSVGRPIAVEVTGGENRRIQPRDTASELYDVAAVREDRPARLVPLRHACGRYVDYVTPPRTRTR